MKDFLRYWLPAFCIFGLIFYLSSKHADELPAINFPYFDKIAHTSIYAALGFTICRALTFRDREEVSFFTYRWPILLSIMAGMLYGISDEWHQSFVPGRSVELADIAAIVVGSTLGAFLTLPYRKWIIVLLKRSQ